MSHSPGAESSADDVFQYDKSWVALNKMIRQGRSFSGRERNCAFLNVPGQERFACVSAAIGADLPDDGRGLALADWDHDGRLDLWLSLRTGPRVRLLHNRIDSGNTFLALRLEGTTANRDAVGARAVLRLAGDPNPIVRTVSAGAGYLSQSSRWLHFGLPAGATVESLAIRWPGGKSEQVVGAEAGAHFTVAQGSGEALRWEPPAIAPEAMRASDPALPDADSSARIVALRPAPLPEFLGYADAKGVGRKLAEHRGKPLLLNLWATWCPSCKAEMARWTAEAKTIAGSGLEVLSLSVDEEDGGLGAVVAKAVSEAKDRGYPFPVGAAGSGLAEVLNIMQKSFIGRQSDLPLPSSFLIDPLGRLAVAYKGHIAPDQLAADAALLGADPEIVLAGAIPFPGKWHNRPEGGQPRSIAVKLVEHGMVAEARGYLRQLLPLYEGEAVLPGAESGEASRENESFEIHKFLAAIAFDEGPPDEAEREYRAALAIRSDSRPAREELVRLLMREAEFAKARVEVKALLEDRPEDADQWLALGRIEEALGDEAAAVAALRAATDHRPAADTWFELGNALRRFGDIAAAIRAYRQALDLRPGWPPAANNLAWILATAPDVQFRNGAEAVLIAESAALRTDRRIPAILGTLAAAYAEEGRFSDASAIFQELVKLIESQGDKGEAAAVQSRFSPLLTRQPIRDAALTARQAFKEN